MSENIIKPLEFPDNGIPVLKLMQELMTPVRDMFRLPASTTGRPLSLQNTKGTPLLPKHSKLTDGHPMSSKGKAK